MISSCYDSSQTPSLRDRRFGDGGQGFEVFEGVDGVFGGEGGFEISGFGGVAHWRVKFFFWRKVCGMVYTGNTNLLFIWWNLILDYLLARKTMLRMMLFIAITFLYLTLLPPMP